MKNHIDICNDILSAQSIIMAIENHPCFDFDLSISAIHGAELLLDNLSESVSWNKNIHNEIKSISGLLRSIYLSSELESWAISRSCLRIAANKLGQTVEKIEEAHFEKKQG